MLGNFRKLWRLQCGGRPAPRPSRRGAMLVAALVALLVVGMIAAALFQSVLHHQRQLRGQAQQLQAFWLAESAISRAAAQLAASPDYPGETWQVTVEQPDGKAGLVAIRVEAAEDLPAARQVTVEAYYPDEPVHRARYEKQVIIQRNVD